MADNAAIYGFRWSQGYNTKPQPQPIEVAVASGQNFTISGSSTNFNLNAGDLVSYTTTGTIIVAGGNENAQTSAAMYGVVVGFGPMYNGTRMVRQPFLGSGVTYGTNVDRQTKVLVVPVSAGYWEADCDGLGSATASTYLGYQALIGENVDHQNVGVTASLQLNPKINIASHAAATTTLSWRIFGISQNFSNQDFAGANVKLIVVPNKGQEPFYTNVGV